MFEHKGVHQCTWHQDTLGRRSMIDFVVVSSDLRPYVLDTRVKRGAELSTDHHLVVSWIRWQRRKLDRPGRPKRIVRVCWERLAEPSVREVFNSHLRKSFSQIPREAGDIESEWTMFSASIVDAAVRKLWDARSLVPVVAATPEPGGGHRKYRQAKQAAARTVLEAKTRDLGGVSCRWGAVDLRLGTLSDGGRNTFEDLLNPTDLPSNEEAEAGVSEVDSSITQAEVTEGITLLSLPGKVYARVLERRIRPIVDRPWIQEEQCGFRPGRGTLDQLSIPSTGCLRVYGSLPNQSTCALWIWRRHSTVSLVVFCGGCSTSMGSGEPLLRAVRSLYDRSRSLVRIAGSKSDLFPVHVGLRQGCPLSPVLFIIFMDRISRHSQGPEGVRFGNHRISSLLFADDVVLKASSGQDLQHVLERFAAECEAAGMRISTSKSEAMVLDRKRVVCPLRVGGEVLPQVEEFKYLGVLFTSEGKIEREIDRRIGAASAVMRSVYRTVVVKKELSRKAKLLDLLPVNLRSSSLTYGHELWGGVPGMSHREEASGKTQDTLERLCLSAGLGTPRGPPEELEEVSGVREVWASLLRLLPPRPGPGPSG
ncbi:hypothetical protein L3Q82_009358 [Scortum barcoo]|uniref:Uncharacterized protein n=1 Tax=Scortum barcoo TaxID=214431 RepID=A0ACB8WJ26_9TELE|nr:hypothetical protein L3Q82_009358 [Scortum barcoo]